MKVSEAFLVNTKNFAPIIETLVNYNADNIVINSDLLEQLSYSDPNDLLVIRILKDFSIIDNDGKPDKYFEEFQNPETTNIALAKGLITAYKGIFDQHPKIHRRPPEKIKEVFEKHFRDKKTDLIIKYISGTFEKIVSYIGVSTVDAVLDGEVDNQKVAAEVTAVEASGRSNNESGDINSQNNSDKNNQSVQKEEISDNNIDDFLNGFETSEPKDTSNTTNAENETNDPSIQEFVNSIEESEMSIEPAEENGQVSDTEERPDDIKEMEEDSNDVDKNKDETEEDDLSFDVNKQSKKEVEATSSEENQEKVAADIDPIDLDLPMSQATKQNNVMQNVTKEHQFVQKALLRKSDLLHKMKRWEELVPTLEEIIDRYDNQENIDFKNAVERAVIRRAIALLKLGENDKALPALDSVINRFKDSNNNEFYEQASRAMLFKVNILEKNEASSDQLLSLYNKIIDRLDSDSGLLLNEKLDEIHCRRFDLIIEESDDDSLLLDASTTLISRFKDSGKRQKYLQKAMIMRAEILDTMGEDEAALQAYDEFLEKFGN